MKALPSHSLRVALLFTAFATLIPLGGCGGILESIFGDSDDDNPPAVEPTGGGPFGGGGDGSADSKPCTGLCLRQKQCGGGATTSLTGTVKDPAGKVPLYNILVYVPNAPVDPIKTGASCDRCGSVSGDPLVTALTDAAGNFKLDNVPVGADIPLVVQVGKWRRQIVIPNVPECVSTALADAQIRLPGKKSEGDMPQMAIASGQADPFECLLVKMGIDLTEFTHRTADGRVHYFKENGIDTAPASPAANTLYGNVDTMKTYDIIFLPCEGGAHNKAETADKNLIDYTTIGGRVFTTHYGYQWLHTGIAPFTTVGAWQPEQSDRYSTTLNATINQGFPKGAAFAQWLKNVGASQTVGTLGLVESRHDLNTAPDPPSTTWMTTTGMPAPNTTATMHITFNTPIGTPPDQQCGRVVYSDFHVSADAAEENKPFPAACKPGDLSAQEKALEFMLFDLSSCIQDDKTAPAPPTGVK